MQSVILDCAKDLPPIPACRTCGTPLCHSVAPFPKPPFYRLFDNNDRSSKTDVQGAKSMIPEARRRLTLVAAELTRIDEARSRLVAEQRILQHLIVNHIAILSPCRQLPDEVLSTIFIYCLPSSVQPSTNRAPLLLTRICRRWRIVALSTPQLWQSITFSCHTSLHPTEVDKWLSRAGCLPLSMAMYLPDARCQAAEEQLKPFANMVISRSSRWQTLHLMGSVFGAGLDASGGISFAFPRLQHLGIDFDARTAVLGIKTIFRDSPLLRTLSYDHAYAVREEELDIPWDQLLAVTLKRCISAKAGFRILRRCPRITQLCIAFPAGYTKIHSRYTDVEHSQLRRLHIQECIPRTRRAYNALFDMGSSSLALPALRDFKYENTDGKVRAFFHWDSFVGLPSRAGFTLHSLSLLGFTTPPQCFQRCFEGNSSLVHLEVGEQEPNCAVLPDSYLDDIADSIHKAEYGMWTFANPFVLSLLENTVDDLAPPDAPAPRYLLPELQTIKLHDVALNTHRSRCLARMIASRMKPRDMAINPVAEEVTVKRVYLAKVSIHSIHWLDDEGIQIVYPPPEVIRLILEPLRKLKDNAFDILVFSGVGETLKQLL